MDMESDRISNLPGHIIDRILSYLPIKDVVRMSILSSKWRYKWASIPHLVFDNQCFPSSQDQAIIRSKLVNIIDRVLLLHTGPIYKFKLSHRDLQAVADIDGWILHISRSSVKEFILEIWKGRRYKIPSCLYLCKNLIHLELFNCLLRLPSSFSGFPNLKSLDIQHISMEQDAFENLISSCPLLESSSNLLKFFLHLPRIQRLEVQSFFLKYLAVGNVPGRLSFARVDLSYLSLRINFNDLKESSAALCIFRSSPNLVELEMLARPEEENAVRTLTSFWLEDGHCNCRFDQLQLVRISDISSARPELDFMRFILMNSPVLENMTVKPASMDGGWEFLKELLRFRRASAQAEIIILDP
ncbi:hypothetical protein Ancab_028918 [Ancistrocladus abbreviatus]